MYHKVTYIIILTFLVIETESVLRKYNKKNKTTTEIEVNEKFYQRTTMQKDNENLKDVTFYNVGVLMASRLGTDIYLFRNVKRKNPIRMHEILN